MQATASATESSLQSKAEELKKQCEKAEASAAEWKEQAEKRRAQVGFTFLQTCLSPFVFFSLLPVVSLFPCFYLFATHRVRQQVEELLEQGRGKESTVAAEAASLREELQAKTRLCDLAKQAGVDMERQLESLRGQNFGMGQRLAAAQAAEAAAQSELQQVNQQRPLHALNSLKIVGFDLF